MFARPATILHIEDIGYLGELVRALIRSWPEFEHIGHAMSGTEGLVLSRERTPDIVLLDLGLPDRDGFEVSCGLAELPVPPPELGAACPER